MSEPIIFISHFRVRQGAIDGLRRITDDVTRSLEVEKPRTLAYLSYVDADGTHVTFIHAFADAESMDLHFEGAEERSRAAYAFLEPDGWEIYGAPSDPALTTIRQAAEASGVKLSVQPAYLDGFLRITPSR
jgi:hypothetical protein